MRVWGLASPDTSWVPIVRFVGVSVCSFSVLYGYASCEGVGGVQGALTLFCGGVAQTCHARCGGSRRRKTGRKSRGRRERSSQRERAMDDMEMTM